MAACARCKKPITGADARRQREVRDDQGRLKSVYHNKCWFVSQKRGPHLSTSPTAYTARRQNADDVTPEARARLEEATRRLAELNATRPEPSGGDGQLSLDDLMEARREALEDQVLAQAAVDREIDQAMEATRRDESDWRDPITGEI